jgi:hypothetical protein
LQKKFLIGLCLIFITLDIENYILKKYLDTIITNIKTTIKNCKLENFYTEDPYQKFTFTIDNSYLINSLTNIDFIIICSPLDTNCLKNNKNIYDKNKIELYKLKDNNQYLSLYYPN